MRRGCTEIHPNDEDEDEEDDEEEHLPPEAEAANAAGTTRLPPPHKPGHRRSLVPEYESRAAKEWDRDNKHFDDAKAGRAFDVHEGLDKPMRREVVGGRGCCVALRTACTEEYSRFPHSSTAVRSQSLRPPCNAISANMSITCTSSALVIRPEAHRRPPSTHITI